MDYPEVQKLDELVIGSEEEYGPQTETSVQHNYVTVLTEDKIWRLVEDEIQRVSDIYAISKAEAILLLPHFRRDVSEFHKKWFDDAKGRKSVGLLERPLVPPSDDKEFFCGVCTNSHPIEKSASVSCGHRVCTYCWTRHINNIISENTPSGAWYSRLKCPYVSCPASVGRDMIEIFASEEEKSKYDRYLFRSYVEDRKMMECCPASGSSCAIDLIPDSGNFIVFCLCLLSFCWTCSKDVHSPVDCKTAAKWLAMNTSGYQNPNWVLANTVPCPKCKRRIKENQDCSLKMTCLPPCNYDFCCRCRGEWTEHGEETGWDSYTCNFDAVSYDEADQHWKMAEVAADRYKDCYENWENNKSLMQKAKANLEKLRTVGIQNLSETQSETVQQLKFIIEAVAQIMECRRVLKWTYAYEYYLREDEVGKQAFLKHTREIAEGLLEKLDGCVETELPRFLDAEESLPDFNAFRIKLTQLTSTTRIHNETLVRALENGLANVVSASEMSQRACDGEASGSGINHDD